MNLSRRGHLRRYGGSSEEATSKNKTSMDEIAPEGWYTDPYGRHEARWMSAGTATRLVRDGEVESSDDPTDEPPSATPVRIATDAGADATDLRRADEDQMQNGYDPKKAARAAWDAAIDQQSGQL